MAVLDARSPEAMAVSAILDREIEASLRGRPKFPNGTVFAPQSIADDAVVERYTRAGSPVGVVDGDGAVVLRRPPLSAAERLALALLAGVLLWTALRGRTRVPISR